MKKIIFAAVFVLAGIGAVAHAQGVGPEFGKLNQQQSQQIQNEFAWLQHVGHKHVCDAETPGNGVQCNAQVVTDANGNAAVTVLPNGYGPAQLLGAYNLTGSLASSPIIAIVDAYDDSHIASDLATYSTTYGIPQLPTCTGSITSATSACFQKLNENGLTSPLPAVNASWDLEISLDVETAHATCQNCRILLVEAKSSSFTDLMSAIDTAVANNATVVSGSWGASEFAGETSYDTHFEKTGVAFTFSAGDGGYATSYPAASPYVTAVGGTSLLINTSTNAYLSEAVWGGTGSGCSLYETKPAWQTDTAGCATRTMNDVSADADPATGAAVYDTVSYDGEAGWFQVGGTSLSAPLIASVYAQAGNISSSVYANSLPYLFGNASDLNDVTSGSNGSCGNYLCDATVGYDGPTGLGSPDGTTAFMSSEVIVPPSFSLAMKQSSVTVTAGSAAKDIVAISPVGGFNGPVAFSMAGLPTGTAVIFNPNPSSATSSAITITTTSSTPAGTYTLPITGTSGSLSAEAAMTLVVNAAKIADFSISATPLTRTVNPYSTPKYTITVAPLSGFTGAVTFSATITGSGVSPSFSPKKVTGGSGSTVLSAGVTGSAVGTYTITVTGTNGSISHKLTVILTVR